MKMLHHRNFTLSLIFLAAGSISLAQLPQGFTYQAVARDASGNPITGQILPTTISIMADSLGTNVIWKEIHSNVQSNSFGLITLTVGKGTRQSGTALHFYDIDWSVTPKFIMIQIDYGGLKTLGVSRLWAVPYATAAGSFIGSKLGVNGTTTNMEEALFEVKNKNGQTIFAVYNEGVRIWVDDGSKGTKGGFAVGGFDMTKGLKGEYLRVTRDSTRVYVKDPVKGTKGGFAIGGFDMTKTATGNYLDITKINYFIGHEGGSKVTTGLYNSAIGYQAGKNLTSGSDNTILGYQAGISANTAQSNIIIGDQAGYSLTSGQHNTLIGVSAGRSHTTERYNIMIGTSAGANINSGPGGWFNTFMGINSGVQIRTSTNNVFIGTNSGMWLDNGQGNTFIGIDAGRSRDESGEPWAYRSGVTASYNTFLGNRAGYYITNGINNLAVGYEAGYSNLNGTGNVFLGYQAGRGETTSNKLYIANSSSDPPLLFGDFSTKMLGINTKLLTATFNVGGTAAISGGLTAGSVSSTNINGTFFGSLNGNVTGNVTGNVNGLEMGRIFINYKGIVQSLLGETFILTFDPDANKIMLENANGDFACSYWYRIVNGGTSTTGSGVLTFGQSVTIINDKIFDNTGFEIHFGEAASNKGYCSVWVQYFSKALIGHYMKY